MTNQNRIGKFCSICLIGIGLAWVGVIAYQMYQAGIYPGGRRLPIGTTRPSMPTDPDCKPGAVRKPSTICAGG